ncbi:MAG: hypothetical protein KGL39_05845 [Patescibacteria group bacterium]|nr:hypothetical protein [Patescibacteria group bacterium]
MAQIPDSVRVGPFRYAIKTDLPGFDRHRISYGDSDSTVGKCSEGELSIYLDVANNHPSLVRMVTLHEVLHAVQNTANIKMAEELLPEEFVGRTAPILLGVLRDNPELVAYLTESDD